MFVLDTDHIGILQDRGTPEHGRLQARIRAYSLDDFFLPIVSFHEQVAGWNAYISRARDQDGVRKAYLMFERTLAEFAKSQIASFDRAAADQFESLTQQRVRIGTMDLRIAAITLSRGMTLLTRNLVDFRQVPGLVT